MGLMGPISPISPISPKKLHWLPKLEVVVNRLLAIGRWLPEHLHTKLVERVVIALADTHRQPGIATCYSALHAYRLGMLLKGFLLFLILHLQQHALVLEFQYG